MNKKSIVYIIAFFPMLISTTFAQTIWNNPVDGVWSNSAAWSAGVPDAETAYLNNNTGSYTVTVDATPDTAFGNLTVVNAAGNTTRLNINAAGFTSTNGLFTFGRGSEVIVNSNGVMEYTGRTINQPFVSIADGGLWRVDGGTVNFSNLKRGTPTSGTSRMYVGNSSTGRLEITSGEFIMTGAYSSETNLYSLFYIGCGTAGRGFMTMTGGKALINKNDAGTGFYIGYGSRSVGVVSLSGDAQMVVSNKIEMGKNSATGTITIADNAILRVTRSSRVYAANEQNGMATINVSDNGILDLIRTDGLFMGGHQNNSKAIMNINGGRVDAGGGVTMCRSLTGTGSYAEVNLNAGELNCGKNIGYGISLARAEYTTGAAHAVLNVNGGLLDISRSMWNGAGSRYGIVMGAVGSVAGSSSLGEMNVTGGTVTNSGQLILGTGLGGTGIVSQTAGDVRQGMGRSGVTCYPMTIGWGGGYGSYTLSGGTFVSAKNVYLGGVTTSDLGYTPTGTVFEDNSIGILRVSNGSFAVTNANLYIGRNGSGTLIVGSNGVCSAKNVILTDNTQSTVRFEFGAESAGSMTVIDTLTVSAGAKLEVDTTAYKGDITWTKLIDCATRSDAFATENISVTGEGVVRQDKDEDIWLYIERGTLILLK
jgi:hypothetical protein